MEMDYEIGEKFCDEYEEFCDKLVKTFLKELVKRGVDTPVPQKNVKDGNIQSIFSSSNVMSRKLIGEEGKKLEGFPLYINNNVSVGDERKSVKCARIIIKTTFEYEVGEEATYKMTDSDKKKIKSGLAKGFEI